MLPADHQQAASSVHGQQNIKNVGINIALRRGRVIIVAVEKK